MAKRANEIIAFHLCWDMSEVSDGRYQPTRYSSPAVYVCGNDYFCCPSGSQKLPKDFAWEKVGEYYGREVYRAEPEKAEPREFEGPSFLEALEANGFRPVPGRRRLVAREERPRYPLEKCGPDES